MPSKNSKNNKNAKGGGKKKPKTTSNFKRPPTGAGVTWESTAPPKPEKTYVQKNFYVLVAGIIFLFLFCLWAFVEDRQTIERQKAAREAARKRANMTRGPELPRKEFHFEYSNLYNSTQFTNVLKQFQEDEDFDRIVVAAFDDSTREAEGAPTKVKLFRKYETIAKSMPRKQVFKRFDEDELPLIISFDCGNPEDETAEPLCKNMVGENIPNVVIFRPKQQPRALPSEYRSDNQIIQYLYNLMLPAVKYLEERSDCEDFVANDEMMNVVLFGDEKTGSYDAVADMLREFARFGKTRNPAAAEEFDTEMGTIMIWKTFGQNPNKFEGNISDSQSVYTYVMNNYVPTFGEFNPSTSNRYMKRGLPILWVAYDRNSDNSKDVLEVAETLAARYVGMMSFVSLDVKSYPQIANNFGIDVSSKSDEEDKGEDEEDDEEDDEEEKSSDDEDDTNRLPQVFIMNQMAQIREFIDVQNVEQSINKVTEEYMRLVRAARGEGLTELEGDDDMQGDDDDELEEDDDEDEDENENDEDTQLQDDDEDEEDDDEEVSAPGPPKEDL